VRGFPKRSVSAVVFLVITLCAVVLVYLVGYEQTRLPVSLLSAGLIFTSVAMLLVSDQKTFLHMLAVHYMFALVVAATVGGELIASLPALIAALVPTIVYEWYPASLALALGYTVASFAACYFIAGASVWSAAVHMLVGVAFSLTGSWLGLYRETCVELQHHTRRLEDTVTALTRAVSASQDIARDAETRSRAAERSRLTRDIHDTVGYTLTNNVLMMEAVKLMVISEPDRIPDFVERIRENTEKGLADLRQILRDLRSYDEPDETLGVAIRRLVRVFSESTGIEVCYELGNTDWPALERYHDAVYHFVQEGLVNAFKHGKAHQVTVFCWDDGERARITLQDDGSGPRADLSEGIGICGMRERFGREQGRIEIQAAPRGFRISGWLPSGGRSI